MIECMQDAGKEDYLRPSERIGLDWILLIIIMLNVHSTKVMNNYFNGEESKQNGRNTEVGVFVPCI